MKKAIQATIFAMTLLNLAHAGEQLGGKVINKTNGQTLQINCADENCTEIDFVHTEGEHGTSILKASNDTGAMKAIFAKIRESAKNYYNDYFHYYHVTLDGDMEPMALAIPPVGAIWLTGAAIDTAFAPVRLPMIALDRARIRRNSEKLINAIAFMSDPVFLNAEKEVSNKTFESLNNTLLKNGKMVYSSTLNKVLFNTQMAFGEK